MEGRVDARWRRRFNYLLVDEFQDINPIQYRLIRAWAQEGESLFAIGDPDQSIYGFRGADAACFERLQADWPALSTIRLRQNYRSTPQVLSVALPLISHNPVSYTPLVKAGLKAGRGLQRQIALFRDLPTDIVRQAAIGKGDVLSPLKYDDLRLFIQPAQPRGSGSPSGHTAYDQYFHPVSYTPLDVYKRQASNPRPWPLTASR